MRKLFFWAGLIVVLAGCARGSGYAPAFSKSLNPGEIVTVTLPADAAWWRTGAALERGVSYRIKAVGRWHAGDRCGWTDPDGVAACPGGIQRLGGAARLIGRIGPDGRPFSVGAEHQFTAWRDGRLEVRMNHPVRMREKAGGSVALAVSRLRGSVAIPARRVTEAPRLPDRRISSESLSLPGMGEPLSVFQRRRR